MERPFRFKDVRTTRFAWAAMLSIVIGWALDALTGPLWVRFGIHATALEYFGGGLAALGYGLLWILLPVSAFRPENRFYMRGDCSLRAKRFGLVLGFLLLVHLLLVLGLAFMWRGGWR
jgi:hypothetical protein